MTAESDLALVAAQRELAGVVFRAVFETSGFLGALAWVLNSTWGLCFTFFAVGVLAAYGVVYLALRHLERVAAPSTPAGDPQ